MSENTAEGEKIEVTKEELKELIDERIGKRLEKENQTDNSSRNRGSVSRRDFLKKIAVGAFGIGALSLPSVSALDVKDDSFEVFTGTGENDLTKYLSVSQGGPVNIQNTNLDLNNQNLKNVNQLNGQSISDLGFSGSYNDLTNRSHGNTDHDTNFLAQSSYTPVSDINSESSLNIDISGDADTLDGSEPSNLKVSNIKNQGEIAAHDGTSNVFLEDGLKVGEVYQNGYPVDYGNIIQIGGGGDGELLLEWTGGDGSTGKMMYRTKRDTSDTPWGNWRTVATRLGE